LTCITKFGQKWEQGKYFCAQRVIVADIASKGHYKQFLYELIWSFLQGKLKNEQVVELLKSEVIVSLALKEK
jgi:hypothetical protein